MVYLNHTAAASSEPCCLSLSQTFMQAPHLPEGWFQITVDGLESSHWFGAKTHYKAWRPFSALDSLVFVLSCFKFDLLFGVHVESRPVPYQHVKGELSQLWVSNSGHLAVIPAYAEINLTGVPFKTTSGNGCRCLRSNAWHGRGVSFTLLL